jgi:O-antigen ligase
VNWALILTAAGVALAAARWVSALAGWPPAGPLALLAATPMLPYAPLGLGLSLDDIAPLVGLLLLAVAVRRAAPGRWRYRGLLCLGLGCALLAALVSAFANAATPAAALALGLRGAGRLAFLTAIALVVASARPSWRVRHLLAPALAVVGVIQATLGLVAYAVPAASAIGLEATRKHSVLHHQVPGRINGTLAISPDFLGAVFVLTIPLTASLAIEAGNRRTRAAWGAAALVQLLALMLSYTRASIVLVGVVLVGLLAARGRLMLLVPVAGLLLLVLVTTPTLERFVRDVPDRLALWSSATRMMADHPVTGVGPGRMLETARADPTRYQSTPFGPAQSNAHNTALLAGAETGIVGAAGVLLLNLGLGLTALGVVLRHRRPGRSALPLAGGLAVLAFLAQGMVNNLFTVGVSSTLFATIVGGFLAYDEDGLPAPPRVRWWDKSMVRSG